ncbi:MAG: magnesium transporter [Lachnospiraceae bacterium]|nr:magnesium transporter [Lachnospiraceae bacterium]
MSEEEIIMENIEEELRQALEARDEETVNNIIDDVHPIDIAIMMEDFSDEEIRIFHQLVDDEKIATILEQADEELQVRLIVSLDNESIIKLFNYMQKDDIVDILGDMPWDRRKAIVNLMKIGDRKTIQDLLGYAEDTAGGIMTTEYISLYCGFSAMDALQKIKEIAPKTEVIETIFVINIKKELIGVVTLRDILTADNDATLESIMEEHFVSVEPEMDQEEVSLLVSKYDLSVVPVINKRKALLGIITVDDIIDVIQEEHTEDMLHMGGVSGEESMDSTLWESIRMRLPWLFVNLVTAFLACFVINVFESTIAQVVALAAVMPIVTGMGGNAGTQTLSIMIRSIALGEVSLKECWKPLVKEALLGIINGAAVGAVTGVIVYFLYGNMFLGVIIFAAMICNMLIAGVCGFVIPLVLKALHADPALASSIFLTTATDVFGFFIFLMLAQVFLPLLI